VFSRDQLKRAASLTEEDFVQLGRCRRPHNRLGFAYQVAFVRLFDRFPQQQPFELFEELVCFSLKTRMEGPEIASFCSRVSTCGSMGSHQEGPSRSDGISLMLSRLRRFDSRHSRF
jgi:hypothetical protein